MTDKNYRGSRMISFRIDESTFADLQAFCARSVLHSRQEPPSASAVVLKALKEFLDKGTRAKVSRKRKQALKAHARTLKSVEDLHGSF